MRYLKKSKVGYIACMHVKYQFLQTRWVEMEAKTVFWTIIFEYFVCIFQQMSKIEFWKYSLPRQLFHQKMGTKTTIYQMFIHNWSFGHNFRCDRGSYLAEKALNFLTFNVKHPVDLIIPLDCFYYFIYVLILTIDLSFVGTYQY